MGAVGIVSRKGKTARASFRLENELYAAGYEVVAGLDEVGRGAWAGPVVAAAVILPRSLRIGSMFDSKTLTKLQRSQLYIAVKKAALSYGIGQASHREIDELGMTEALRRTYSRALQKLATKPSMVLLDGLPISKFTYKHRAVVGGDQKSKSIAAASIIAKEYRDALMTRLSLNYPQYGFDLHKGYGTPLHQQALTAHGVCAIHRTRYRWVSEIAARTV